MVTNKMSKTETVQIDKLAEKVNDNKNCSKDWWKALKTFIKPNQT